MKSPRRGFRRWVGRQALRFVVEEPDLRRAVVRAAGTPSMWEMSSQADPWCTTAAPFLGELLGPDESPELRLEGAEAVVESILGAAASGSRRYPRHYTVEHATSCMLYALVRGRQPEVVVETGVADGLSSAVILNALAANGHGVLHSIDIVDDVGSLVSDRSAWRLHVFSEAALEADLKHIAATVGPIDLFFHDANHDYGHQMSEYTTFWPSTAPHGCFLSDDVDGSYAFLDFAAQVDRRTMMLLDRRKVLGAIRPRRPEDAGGTR